MCVHSYLLLYRYTAAVTDKILHKIIVADAVTSAATAFVSRHSAPS